MRLIKAMRVGPGQFFRGWLGHGCAKPQSEQSMTACPLLFWANSGPVCCPNSTLQSKSAVLGDLRQQ